MAIFQACVLVTCLALAAGQSAILGDSVSVVQGLVHAHQHIRDGEGVCSGGMMAEEVKEKVDANLAAKAEIVVTRGAGEDLRWLDAIPEIRAVVYNRNGLDELLPKPRENLKIVHQENIKREDDAMLRHIINNYNQLAEVTMFLQGWPFWHCGGALETVKRTLKNMPTAVDQDFIDAGAHWGLVPLASSYYQYSVKDGLLGAWNGFVMAERKATRRTLEETVEETKRSFNETCSQVLGSPCPARYWVSEGSQWAVSSSRILSRTKEYYQQLLDMSVQGNEIRRTLMRGLVLESLWPAVWGISDWAPSKDLLKHARNAAMFSALKRVDSPSSFCLFTTDRSFYPTAGERRGVCELERHAAGKSSGIAHLMATEGTWSPTINLRAVLNHVITKDEVEAGSKKRMPLRPKKTYSAADAPPICSKRHIWPANMITRLRNKASGECMQHTSAGFVLAPCQQQVESQQLHLLTNHNNGFVAIQDKTEVACISHGLASGGSTKCNWGVDSGVVDSQRWQMVRQGNGAYQMMAKGTHWCISHKNGKLGPDVCEGPATHWELSDADTMGQYYEKFDLAITEFADGKLKMRCTMRLHSSSEQASLDLVEPEWRKRGSIVNFHLKDASNGTYFLVRRSSTGEEKYLGCDAITRDAIFSESPTAWGVHPVNDGFVYLESEGIALQYIPKGGFMKCTQMADGMPPQDTAFAIEFQEVGRSRII
uniref:Ricin B lectin domain-containing protein n=1 Tax=Alexandrium monilatum TaxID=311494 RepID=A0A7S4VTB0_9DINO